MDQIRYIADAIDEVVYLISIAFSIYQGIKFVVDSWTEIRRIEAEIEERKMNIKKWKAVLKTIEAAEPLNTKIPMFKDEDCATTSTRFSRDLIGCYY